MGARELNRRYSKSGARYSHPGRSENQKSYPTFRQWKTISGKKVSTPYANTCKRNANKINKTPITSTMKDPRWIHKHPIEDKEINLMAFVKSICLTLDVDAICDEAEEWVKGRGVLVVRTQTVRPLSSNNALWRLWVDTLLLDCKPKVGGGGARLMGWQGRRIRARGGPRYGINHPSTHADHMDTIIHELAHVVHLTRFKASIINGKRRPHDLLYNRIMLKMMQAYLGLSEQDCNPIRWGWGVGEGYAPTRRIKELHQQMLNDKHPKVMRWFK